MSVVATPGLAAGQWTETSDRLATPTSTTCRRPGRLARDEAGKVNDLVNYRPSAWMTPAKSAALESNAERSSPPLSLTCVRGGPHDHVSHALPGHETLHGLPPA